MVKYRIFRVNDQSWKEHNSVGIAAINDGVAKKTGSRYEVGEIITSKRQAAIAEISSIRPGDILLFNKMSSTNHPPEIFGIFQAETKAYFDPSPLYSGADFIKKNFPFRVKFKCIHNLINPISMDEIWALRDKGKIWTIQQSRGDAVGKHACLVITKIEAQEIIRLLKANNIVEGPKIDYKKNRRKLISKRSKSKLPTSLITDPNGELHYEANLQTLLLNDFCLNKHKKIFGDYDDVVPYVPTPFGKEIDILLLKYNNNEILWYGVLELKQNKFKKEELKKIIDYEKSLISNRNVNPLQIHCFAIAANFDDDVKEYAKQRVEYKERPINLIKYYFNKKTKKLILKKEEIK